MKITGRALVHRTSVNGLSVCPFRFTKVALPGNETPTICKPGFRRRHAQNVQINWHAGTV